MSSKKQGSFVSAAAISTVTILLLLSLLPTPADAFGNWFRSRAENPYHGGLPKNNAASSGRPSLPRSVFKRHEPKEVASDVHVTLGELQQKASFSPCWKTAVKALEKSCEDSLATDDARSRLALKFASCQLEMDGKISAPLECPDSYDVRRCVAALGDAYYAVYVQLRIHTMTLCFHIQETQFQDQTRQTIGDLGQSAQVASGKMKDLGTASDVVRSQLDGIAAGQQDAQDAAIAMAKMVREHAGEHDELMQTVQATAEKVAVGLGGLKGETDAMKAKHEVAVSELMDGLGDLKATQVEASGAADATAEAVRRMLNFTATEMLLQRELIANVSRAAEDVVMHAQRQHDRLTGSSSHILDVLETLQKSFSTFDAMLFYTGVTFALFFLTSATSTASARLWTMVSVLLCFAVEQYVCRSCERGTNLWLRDIGEPPFMGGSPFMRWVMLTLSRDSSSPASLTADVHAAWAIRNVFFLLELGLVLWARVKYTSPADANRMMVREELRRLFGDQAGAAGEVGSTASGGDGGGSGSVPMLRGRSSTRKPRSGKLHAAQSDDDNSDDADSNRSTEEAADGDAATPGNRRGRKASRVRAPRK